MIDAVLSVCGDEKYFSMAKISIPSFLRANPTCNLHVFTDRPSEIATDDYKLNVYNFAESIKNCDKLAVHKIITLSDPDFDNNKILHHHPYVALLPLIAQAVVGSDYILKIDVDAYFVGDMISEVERIPSLPMMDLCLISRTDDSKMKLYGGAPGVGFLLWKRSGKFVETYVKEFAGYEQTDILGVRNKMNYGELTNENFHLTYPFYQARKLGEELTKKKMEKWIPFYAHVCGEEDFTQLEKLQKMKEWFK